MSRADLRQRAQVISRVDGGWRRRGGNARARAQKRAQKVLYTIYGGGKKYRGKATNHRPRGKRGRNKKSFAHRRRRRKGEEGKREECGQEWVAKTSAQFFSFSPFFPTLVAAQKQTLLCVQYPGMCASSIFRKESPPEKEIWLVPSARRSVPARQYP